MSLLLCAFLGACRRSAESWLAELKHTDPWRRRMGALALARVDEAEVEAAFRALTIRLLELDPEVSEAMHGSLRALARRRPELPAQALGVLPPERHRFRMVMANLLVELERAGNQAAGADLARYLEAELASGVPIRVQAALKLQRKRQSVPSDPSGSSP